MKKKSFSLTRRQVLKAGLASGAGLMLPWRFLPAKAFAEAAIPGLSDPAAQPKFEQMVPDALAPGFIYQPDRKGRYKIKIGTAVQQTGLKLGGNGPLLNTPVWGYGHQKDRIFTWPGRTFQVKSFSAGGPPETQVYWANSLDGVTQHLLPVDTNLHWCYALHGYTGYTIANAGVPIITHLHGGKSDFQFDGNPEFFYNPDESVTGPQWANVPDGFTTKFRYNNDVPAGNLWYHDHALGITRLNVYAGLAGFYFVRDEFDTGESDNPLGLPAWPYEKAYAIQDRMFRETGELFYPAFPGEPFYDDFITDEGAELPPELFPGGGPTALAEFFGDHFVVNGKIWPKEDVDPRNYRLHLLNGTDSRFMAIRFRVAASPTATDLDGAGDPLSFYVIGSDQGLASQATSTETLLFEPGSRYDIVFDFKDLQGQRIIMENIAGDEPFGGDLLADSSDRDFSEMDRVMAFDVANADNIDDDFEAGEIGPYVGNNNDVDRLRKVALFEGKGEFGRLQPLLGTAELATDYMGNPINWPATPVYAQATLPDGTPSPLIGQMEGAIAWHSPTTENPALGHTEEWEVWNATGDAHPVHLHLVNFEVLGRKEIVWDSNTIGPDDPSGEEEDRVTPNALYNTPAGDGTYKVKQPVVQHNTVDTGLYGIGFRLVNLTTGDDVILDENDGYVENAPKDMGTFGDVHWIIGQFFL